MKECLEEKILNEYIKRSKKSLKKSINTLTKKDNSVYNQVNNDKIYLNPKYDFTEVIKNYAI